MRILGSLYEDASSGAFGRQKAKRFGTSPLRSSTSVHSYLYFYFYSY